MGTIKLKLLSKREWSVEMTREYFGQSNVSRRELNLVVAAAVEREKPDLSQNLQLEGKNKTPKYENNWTMKSVTNIIFMTGFESRCNVVARCINELREWKWNVCIQENAWKNAENEEKTGRIEASWAHNLS
jgi:hypothetical protein